MKTTLSYAKFVGFLVYDPKSPIMATPEKVNECYIVEIHHDPRPVKYASIDAFLDPCDVLPDATMIPSARQGTARNIV